LVRKAAAAHRYFAASSFAHGARYWAAMLTHALHLWAGSSSSSTSSSSSSSSDHDDDDDDDEPGPAREGRSTRGRNGCKRYGWEACEGAEAAGEEGETDPTLLTVHLSGVGAQELSFAAVVHHPALIAHQASRVIVAAASAGGGGEARGGVGALSQQQQQQALWSRDAHRSLVSAALAAAAGLVGVRRGPGAAGGGEAVGGEGDGGDGKRVLRQLMVQVGSGVGLSVLEAAASGWDVVALEVSDIYCLLGLRCILFIRSPMRVARLSQLDACLVYPLPRCLCRILQLPLLRLTPHD